MFNISAMNDDYGFGHQVDYSKVMKEGRKHKRETSTKSSINDLHSKLQKPISKDNPTRFTKKKKRWWWKKAFPFFKLRKWPISTVDLNEDRKARNFVAMSGPVYATESRTGSSTPYRMKTKPSSARKSEVAIPYHNLRELNVHQPQRISTSSLPIYLVT